MNKQAQLEQIKQAAFQDELEKIALSRETILSAARKSAIRAAKAFRAQEALERTGSVSRTLSRPSKSGVRVAAGRLKGAKSRTSFVKKYDEWNPQSAREAFAKERGLEKQQLKSLGAKMKELGVTGSPKEFAERRIREPFFMY